MAGTTPSPTSVVTGPVRLSYAHILTPKVQVRDDGQPGEAKYSAMLLIPKTDKKTIAAIRRAQQAALADGVARGRFKGNAPKVWHDTLRDGDEEGETPELEGMMFMNVSGKRKPGVVDRNVQPILDETEVYSGMWAKVAINAFAYNTNGKKGISFGLNHVQKVRDDERLDGSSSAEDVFGSLDDDEESLI